MKVFLVLLAACSLSAANIPVTASEKTSTSVILRYHSTIPGACTIIVSESSALSPVVNAVNGTLFTGSNTDTGSPLNNGLERNVVVGQQTISQGSDNNWYSLALHAATQHFGSVTCGSDSGTFTFVTVNPRLASPPLAPLFNSAQFGNYAQPTINWTNPLQNYIDPQTGILLRRITTPGDVGDGTDEVNQQFNQVNPQANWTNLNNILTTNTYATYGGTGTTSDAIVLRVNITGGSGAINASWTANNLVQDLRFHLSGYSDNSNTANSSVNLCLTQDNGQTCASATQTLTFPMGSGSAAQETFPASGYPTGLFSEWLSAGQAPPITPNIATRTGTVNLTGLTNVNLQSGDSLQDLVAGDWMYIAGSGCPNGGQCVIVSITNAYNAVVSGATTNVSGASYAVNAFGVKVWKQTATGTLNLNSAYFDYAFDTHFAMPESGEFSQCSNVPAPTTVSANGTPLGYAQSGWNCALEDAYGNARWYWIGTNGESRHISNLTVPAVSSPPDDVIGLQQNGCFINGSDPISSWDYINPKFWCLNFTGPIVSGQREYNVLYSLSYNASAGGYQSWSANWDLNTENPNIAQVNTTPASTGMDLATQAVSLYPSFNASYFSRWSIGSTRGPYFTFFPSTQENSIGYFVRFNVSTGSVSNVVSTFHDAIRWCGVHGTSENNSPGYGAIYCAPLLTAGAQGIGQYQSIPLSIEGLGSTALTSGYTDSMTCEQLGVTNPVYIAGGATGNNCIKVTMNSQPYNPTPYGSDATTFPYTSGSISCSGCSQLQFAAEGDYLMDSASENYGEQFRFVKDLGGLVWVLQRGASTCNETDQQYQSHSSGWVALMQPAGVCNATFYWINSAGVPSIDNAQINSGHHDLLTNGTTDAGTYVAADSPRYDIRTGPFSTQIGQGPTFESAAYSPLFNGSTAAMDSGAIQSHPSARQNVAPANEFRWMLDGRPFGLTIGGGTTAFTNTVTSTSVTNVYLVGSAFYPGAGQMSELDRKNLPLQVWAGRYLLHDISGPGSNLTTDDAWDYCVVDLLPNECISGSTVGQVYMNVPQADTSGTCLTQLVDNTPCWVSAAPTGSTMTQVEIDQNDLQAVMWRRISSFFNGLGWQSNFDNLRPLPDGSWAFTDAVWANGTYTPLMLAQLPPWPPQPSNVLNGFTQIPFGFAGISGSTRRIRFGYGPSLYCTSRLEQCSTAGAAPYTWVSESQTWTSCSSKCTINVPAIPGKTVYYIIDTQIGGNTVSSGLQATVAN